MSSIDNRIVQMQFENSQFEKGVQQSMDSIEKLEDSLQFKKAEKGLQSLQKAGDSFSLAQMAKGIEKIEEKFSVMGIVGKRIIEDITDSAVRMGEQFVRSISIDQISSGWSKYAQKTEAVQTIIAATGKDIGYVEAQLEKLNWFTDETSYDFVDMTSNIGKFTSMGIDLETSVTAMQGIATWAAVSGQNAQTASRAMYNMSQAIGVGSVKLMDWKSIENANMATKEFKQTAIETAKALGKLNAQGKTAKGTAVTYENFSQTLSEGWFTKDVLLKTLDKYGEYANKVYEIATEKGIPASEAMELITDDTMALGEKAFKAAQEAKTFADAINSVKDAVSTGWMNIFQDIFGNYEEAKELWTDLANYLWDMFAAPLSNTHELLSEWNKLGGRTELLQGIYDVFEGIANIVETVKEAIADVFPPVTVDNLLNISHAVAEFGKNFKETFSRTEQVDGVVYKKIVDPVKELIEEGNFALGQTGENVSKLQQKLVELGLLENKFANGIYNPATQKAVEDFNAGLDATSKILNTSLKMGDKGKEVEELQKKLQELGFDPGGIDGIWGKKTQKAFDAYRASLGKTGKVYKELRKGMRGEDVKELQQALIDAKLLDEGQADGIFGPKTEAALKKYQEAKGLTASGIVDEDTYKNLFPDLGTTTDEYEEEYTYVTKYSTALEKLQGIVKGLSAALDVLGQFFGFIGKVLGHLGKLLAPLGDAFLTIGASLGLNIQEFDEWLKTSGTFEQWFEDVKEFLEPFGQWVQNASDKLLEFFGLSKGVSKIDFQKVGDNFVNAIKGLFGIKVDASEVVDNIDTESIIDKIKNKIVEVYTSVRDWIVGLFSGAKSEDGQAAAIKLDGYNLAIGAIGVITAVLAGRLLQAIGVVVKAGKNVNEILKKIKGTIGEFKKRAAFENMDKAADAVLKFAGAIIIIAGAIWILSQLSWEQLAVGLVGLVTILGVLAGSVYLMSKFSKKIGDIEGTVKALFILSLAVMSLGISVLMLSQLGWEGLAKGIVGVAVLLALAIGSLYFLNNMKVNVKEVTGTIGMLGTLAATIGQFANVMAKIGSMDTAVLEQGLIGMTAVMLVLGLFMKAMDGIKLNWATVAGILISAVAIDLVVLGFLAMAYSMKLLTTEEIIKGFIGMMGVILTLGLLLKAADMIDPSVKSILALLPAAIAIDLVVLGFLGMLFALKSATPEEIINAIIGIGAVVLAIGVLLKICETIKPNFTSVLALLPAAIAIDLLVLGFIGMMFALKKARPEDLMKAIIGIGSIVLLLGGLFMLMERTKPSIGSIMALIPAAIALDLVVIGFIGLLLTMKRVSTQDMMNSIIALGSIVLLMGGLMAIMEKVHPNLGAILALIPVALALDVAIIGFVLLAHTMKKVSTRTLKKTLLAFGAVALGIAAIMWAVSKINFSVKTIAGMLVLFIGIAAVMVVFALVLKMIKEIDPNVMYAFSISLALALGAFVAACMIVGKIPGGPMAMIKGAASIAAAFDAFVVIIGALLVGIGAINEATGGGLEKDINSAANVLTAIGKALSGFTQSLGLSGEEVVLLFAAMELIGLMPGGALALIAGAASIAGAFDVFVIVLGAMLVGIGAINEATGGGLEKDVESAGNVLSALADALVGFTEGLSLSGEDLGIILGIMELIGLLPGGALALIAGSGAIAAAFDVFVLILGGFVAGIGAIDTALDGGLVDAINHGGEVLESISTALARFQSGFNKVYNEDMAGFAEAIGAVKENTEGMSEDENLDSDIQKALEIAQKIHDFFDDLTSYTIDRGGFDGYLTAASELSTDMSSFGTAIEDFRTGVGGISDEKTIDDDTDTAIRIATKIKESFFDVIADQTPDGQGLKDYNSAISSVVGNVKTFATTMGTYHKNISGFNSPGIEDDTSAAITAATAVADFLVDLKEQSDKIENNKSAIDAFFTGDTTQKTVFDAIEALGTSVQSARQNLKGIGGGTFQADLASAMTTLSKIVGVLAYLKENEVTDIYTTGDFDQVLMLFNNVADKIVEFNTTLTDNNVSESATSSIATIMESIGELVSALSGSGPNKLSTENFLSGLDLESVTTKLDEFSGYLGTALDGVVTDISDYKESFSNAGIDLAGSISSGLSEGDLTIGLGILVLKALTTLDGYKKSFFMSGGNFTVGLANGVAFNAYLAVKAAASVAQKMAQAVNNALGIRSPSRVAAEAGAYFTEGLAMGTTDKVGEATDAAEKVANSMLTSASGTLATLSGLLADDIDVNPVIAPVVDLTQARESAALIGGLFGNPSVGVTSSVLAKDAMVSTNNGRPITIQNGTMSTTESLGSVTEQLNALTSYLTARNDGPHVSEMESLTEKFGDLAEAVTGLKIVLDTGTLVGELTPALDTGLGNYAAMRDRGN